MRCVLLTYLLYLHSYT